MPLNIVVDVAFLALILWATSSRERLPA